jgi:hypothetical protein
LAEDTDTLRALLLVAIQDDQFETIRDNIVHKPTLSIDEILKDIRKHNTSMQMKDGACNITGDGTTLSGQQTTSYTRASPEMCDLWRTLEYPVLS